MGAEHRGGSSCHAIRQRLCSEYNDEPVEGGKERV
eukprot:SAG11_NODE_275_length_11309_cov_6.090901_15_plen_35_part_00